MEQSSTFSKAREKGELHRYFGGYPEYAIEDRTADLPTDYALAFSEVRRSIVEDISLRSEVVTALQTLANDAVYGWMVMFYIGQLAKIDQKHSLGLIDKQFVSSIAEGLSKNQDALLALKQWEGRNHPDGVWGLVRNKNRNLHNDYNITVLSEEL